MLKLNQTTLPQERENVLHISHLTSANLHILAVARLFEYNEIYWKRQRQINTCNCRFQIQSRVEMKCPSCLPPTHPPAHSQIRRKRNVHHFTVAHLTVISEFSSSNLLVKSKVRERKATTITSAQLVDWWFQSAVAHIAHDSWPL